jgi:hypothetical protein
MPEMVMCGLVFIERVSSGHHFVGFDCANLEKSF